jgi:hypothetical protein
MKSTKTLIPPYIVILRPPKDLAVLPCTNKGLCHVNNNLFVILRPPKDRAVLYSPKSKKKKEVCKQKTLPFWKGFEII